MLGVRSLALFVAILVGCASQSVPKKEELQSLIQPLAVGPSGILALSDGTVGGYSSGLSFEKVVFSTAGKLVGGVAREGIFVWDLKTPPIISRTLKTRVSSVRFVNDDTALLFGGVDGRVYRWRFLEEDTPKKPSIQRYIGHGSVVSAVAGGVGSPIFFSGDWLGVVSVWLPYDADRFSGRFDENIFGGTFFTDANKVRETKNVEGEIESMVANQDRLFIGRRDGKIEHWSIRGLRRRNVVDGHAGGTLFLDVGQVLVSAGRDGLIKIWSLDLEPLETIEQRGVKDLRLDGLDLFVLLESGAVAKFRVSNS
jgi:WD40 repeat protein